MKYKGFLLVWLFNDLVGGSCDPSSSFEYLSSCIFVFVFLYLYAINGWFAPTGSRGPSGSSESGQHRAELERVVAVSSSSMHHRQNCEN